MPLTRLEDNRDVDEESPLLPQESQELEVLPGSTAAPSRTPLPIAQISVLATGWLVESITSYSISPYLNQLVRELPDVGGDARKVGYYTGLIISLHHAADTVSSFQWNRLSDHVGRKPVLLACLVGTTLSTILFGLSHSFLALVLSRCLHGAMKGHMGAVKSMIGDLTDETNVARGFTMPPTAWSVGCVIGPLIGGILSRPQDRWPNTFSHPFWADFPYFLPCLAAAAFTSLSCIICAFYLEETLKSRQSGKLRLARANSDTLQGELGDTSVPDTTPTESDKPPPLRSVLTKPVMVSVANYAMLTLLSAVTMSYIPLVWSTPVEYGGLSLGPASIGLGLSVYGSIGGFFQLAFFPYLVSRFGLRRVFLCSVLSAAVIYALFPFENLAMITGGGGGPNAIVWFLIILQMSSLCVFDMGYSAMDVYVSSAAPNKRSLGAAFGLSHVVNSIQRTVGPAAGDWLFAFSLTHNVLGGNFAYVVLLGVVCATWGVSTYLPRNTWAHRKEQSR